MYLVFICMPGESYPKNETVGWGFHHLICMIMYFWWSLCTLHLYICMPGESYPKNETVGWGFHHLISMIMYLWWMMMS